MENNDLARVLCGLQPSKIPVIFTGASFAARLVGTTIGEMRQNARKMVEAQVNFQRITGMDWIVIYSDALPLCEVLGSRVTITDKGPVIDEYINIDTFNGAAEKFTNTPSCKILLESLEIVANENPQLPIAVLFEAPFTLAARIFGIENVLIMLIERPELLKEKLDIISEFVGNFAKEACKRNTSIFYMPDPLSSKNVISLNHYKEFAYPYQKSLASQIRSFGGYSIFHICGDTKDRWQEMVDTGAHALSLDQVVDFKDTRKVVGTEAILIGNVDPIETLLKGTPSQVAVEAEECIVKGGPANFVLAPGCGVPRDCSVENLQTMVKVTKEFSLVR